MNKWNKIPFTESIVKNKTAVSSVNASDYLETGAIPVIDQSVDFIAGYTNKAERIVSKELLPVIVFGDHTRVLKYIDFPFVTGADGTKLLFPNKSLFNSKFFYYNLLSKPISNRGYNRHYKLLQELIIDLPTLPQQQVIVHILDIIDKKINYLRNKLSKYEQLKQSVMAELFRIENNFSVLRVEELVETNVIEKPLDGNHGEKHPVKEDFVNSGIPFIVASDIINNDINFKVCKHITEVQSKTLNKGFSFQGDVLLTHKGTIGNTYLLKDLKGYPYVMLSPQVTYYRVLNKDVLSSEYLYYFFQSTDFQKELIGIAEEGSTRAYIGITKQLKLHITIPPLTEQNYITETLKMLDRKISVLRNSRNKYEELFTSFMQKLMNQEIDVSNLEFKNA